MPAGRPHAHLCTFSIWFLSPSSPSTYARHLASASRAALAMDLERSAAASRSARRALASSDSSSSSSSSGSSNPPTPTTRVVRRWASGAGETDSPRATATSRLAMRVTWPAFPARTGPRVVSADLGALTMTSTRSTPPSALDANRWDTRAG